MYICEKCSKNFEIDWRAEKSGVPRFCSRSCANSHKQTKEQNKNRSILLNKTKKRYCLFCGIKICRRNLSGYCNFCVRKTEEYSKILSNSFKGKVGGLRKGSGRGKHGWYRGYWCDSSWELAFVIYCLEHDIKIYRNNEGFEYIFEEKTYKYYPDFIMEDGSYTEIKGYLDSKNLAKINQFKKNLKIIGKKEIKYYLDYAIEKYGKDYIKLYNNS